MNTINKIRQAINWWLQGLICFCPSFLKRSIGLTFDKITIEFNEQQVIVKHFIADNIDPLKIYQFEQSDDIQRTHVLKWIDELQQHNAKIVLVTPENIILKKTLFFPSAAQSNLREALGFELNRKTPFNADQVCYDYKISGCNNQAKKLQIELCIVPKNNINPLLTLLEEWNLPVDEIKPVHEYPDESCINMLPQEQQNKTNNNVDTMTAFLAVSTFSLLLTFLFLPIIQQEEQIQILEQKLQADRKATVQLQILKDEKQNIIEQSNFLEDKYQNSLTGIKLLLEITKILPDDTWLTRMVLRNNKIQLQGESANASSLIQIIESSEIFSQAQFRSPVTQNNTNGKDKFHLSAKSNYGVKI